MKERKEELAHLVACGHIATHIFQSVLNPQRGARRLPLTLSCESKVSEVSAFKAHPNGWIVMVMIKCV